MHPLGQQIGKRRIHRTLAGDAVLTLEGGGHHVDRKVRFAPRIMAGMAAMLLAVVDNGEMDGGKGGAQARFDFGGDGAFRILGHRPYIDFLRDEGSLGERRTGDRREG
jgi:hypothetical protein